MKFFWVLFIAIQELTIYTSSTLLLPILERSDIYSLFKDFGLDSFPKIIKNLFYQITMNSSSNFNQVDFDFLPIEEYSLEIKICVVLIIPILVSLILFLNLGIVYYEKFGHDPQKRNLSNMMISSFCLGLGVLNAFFALFGSIRIIFGPFDILNSFGFLVVSEIMIVFVRLCVLEVGIYRLLAVYIPKTIIGLNDDFFHCFFNCWNLMMACIISLTSNWDIAPWTNLENYGPVGYIVSFIIGQELHSNNSK